MLPNAAAAAAGAAAAGVMGVTATKAMPPNGLDGVGSIALGILKVGATGMDRNVALPVPC